MNIFYREYALLIIFHWVDNQKVKETDEFPIPIDLGRDFQFHSVFVCPVTKEISTEDNPPMLLKCNHVISE